MGRLNYTNRKIEGLKLGQAVAKDLVKRIPPNLHAKAALRDPVVELDVTGKSLGSDGFHEVATALVQSIEYHGEQGRVARLEELCLRDNKLDAKCLMDLGLVIGSAAHDLEDLDLSHNCISIITDQDTAAFEYFLRSFAECYVLRRVDFGGNALGTRAFEILAKVYGSEDPVYLTTLDGLSDPGGPHTGQNSAAGHDSGLERRLDSLHVARSAEAMDFYATARGLRSIPYLVFTDTSMTESCALHLSNVVPHHFTPSQLLKRVPPPKAGLPAQRLLTYDTNARCQGIVYFPNDKLGSAGAKVLELAEQLRRTMLQDMDLDSPEPSLEQDGHGIAHLANELDRARSRIQGNSLRGLGPKSNVLWHTALKMLCLGRIVCQSEVKKPPTIQADENREPTLNGSASPGRSKVVRINLAPRRNGDTVLFRQIPTITSDCNANSSSLIEPALLRPHKPMPLVSRSPNQPVTLRLGHGYQNGKLVLTPIAPTPHSPQSPPSPAAPKTPPPREQVSEVPQVIEIPYRTELPCGFTDDTWRRIAAYCTGANGILSEGQQLAMTRWAMDRETLAQEKESLGKPKGAQIWKVLDSTGCLAYEMKS